MKKIVKIIDIISIIIIAAYICYIFASRYKSDTDYGYPQYVQIWNDTTFHIWKQAADELKEQITEKLLQEFNGIIELDFETDETETELRVTVHISTQSDYRAFLNKIDKLSAKNPDKYISLLIRVDDYSNIKLYLDEIAAGRAITYLKISGGGVITTKADMAFHNNILTQMSLWCINDIEGNILNGFEAVNDFTLTFGHNSDTDIDAAGLLNNSLCRDIKVIIGGYSGKDGLLNELVSEQKVIETAQKERRSLSAVYKLHQDGYCYTAYLLNDIYNDEHPHVFICVEGEERATEGYYDIIEIPTGAKLSIKAHKYQPIRLEDVNFDGYKDINFVGEASGYTSSYNYYRFLWSSENQKYELSKTAPSLECKVDTEQKRLLASKNRSYPVYYIYTYEDGEYIEKALRTDFNANDRDWDYYENGEFKANLLWLGDSGEGAYVYTDSNGGNIKGIFEAENENDVAELQKQFFPDFDFIVYKTPKSKEDNDNNKAIEIVENNDYGWNDYYVESGTDIAELLNDTERKDIRIMINDYDENWHLLKELTKEQKLIDAAEAEMRYLAAVYQVCEDGYCYTAYILNDIKGDRHPHVFICVEGEGAAAGYFDIIEISPASKLEIYAYDAQPIRLEDVNFDGYKDLIFIGDANNTTLGDNIYTFLWNSTDGKFEWCESAPSIWSGLAAESKILTSRGHLSVFDETYYIYTYVNGTYLKKALHMVQSTAQSDGTTWDYYENDELIGNLFWDGEAYIYTGSDGSITEGIFPENGEKGWVDLQERFFPEFDFYNNG